MLECSACKSTCSTAEPRWRCGCGGYLRLVAAAGFTREALRARPHTLWRYHEALGVDYPRHVISLGEGWTPLVESAIDGRPVLLKLDYLCPTGSFKDRGSSVMVSKLREWGVDELVEDSSGNAGASVAAYCAGAGIGADIYVPASASAGKLAQIGLYGARLHRVEGSREDTTTRAMEAAARSFYASHNWSPFFVAGCKTLAYELAEQLDWQPPDWVVLPAGGGSLLLGLYAGFRELREAGLVGRIPRLAAVQAARCAPVYAAWRAGLSDVAAVEKRDTAAEGISVVRPVKGQDILEAVRGSNGVVWAVDEPEIWQALRALGAAGIYVEPTSAVAAAACAALQREGVIARGERVVVELTGSGLKATDKILEHFATEEA